MLSVPIHVSRGPYSKLRDWSLMGRGGGACEVLPISENNVGTLNTKWKCIGHLIPPPPAKCVHTIWKAPRHYHNKCYCDPETTFRNISGFEKLTTVLDCNE